MSLRSTLRAVGQARRALKTLDRIAAAEERIATVLERMAEVVAPDIPLPTPADLAKTGVTHSRDSEFAKIEDYIESTLRRTGVEPTEDQILAFLEGRPG